MALMVTSLADKAENVTASFGFLVPLLIPWMQELCVESATNSMQILYELPETTIPYNLLPKTSLKFDTIRDSIIPQLFKFIMTTPDPNKYLTDRFDYYYIYNPKTRQLSQRSFELFISSLLSDLITYQHYQQRNNKHHNDNNDFLNNMLPLELSMIVQYIKILIWEYHQSIDIHEQYIYDEKLCTISLLTILNHEYTHHLLIERYHQNVAAFSMFAEYLHDNAVQLSKLKNNIKQLKAQIDQLKTTKTTETAEQTEPNKPSKAAYRPWSHSLPQRPQRYSLPHSRSKSPLPIISRIDVQPIEPTVESMLNTTEQIMWQPLEKMYKLFEPTQQNSKKFQRIREAEAIPPPPKHTLPKNPNKSVTKYKIIPKKMLPKKPRPTLPPPISPRSATSNHFKISIEKSMTTPTFGAATETPATEANVVNFMYINSKKPSRRIRTMTLSRPAKLESLSKHEFMGKYLVEMSRIIGQGSFAKIYRCKKKNNERILAMKIVKKQKANSDDVRAMRREISALALVFHRNVIRIHDWCETTQHIFIVLDYCGGGNVFDRVMEQQTFTEIQASKLIKQVALALKHLHSLGIVHRDLKPENLMYVEPHDNTMKIIDFGLSNRLKINGKLMSQTDIDKKNIIPEEVFSLETPCGTPHYAAPELIRNVSYGTPVDLWALGVIIYLLLCGFPPFFDTNIKNMFNEIKKGKFHFPSPFWDTISDEAKDLIKKLLNIDAKKRYTAKQTLSHPWITGEFVAAEADSSYIDNIPLPQSAVALSDRGYDEKQPEPLQQSAITLFSHVPSCVSYTSVTENNNPISLENEESVVVHKSVLSTDGVIGTPINEESAAYNKITLLSPKSNIYFGDHVVQTPPVPFHVESELFPDIDEGNNEIVSTSVDLDDGKKKNKITRVRGTTNVAYMVDGTIFQIQKQQINKLKLEIQLEQKTLVKLSNKLQIERQTFIRERKQFEVDRKEWQTLKKGWIDQHSQLKQLKSELNNVVNKFLAFKGNTDNN